MKPRDKVQGVVINPDKPSTMIPLHDKNNALPKYARKKKLVKSSNLILKIK